MKKIAFPIICMALVFLSLSCDEVTNNQIEDYSVSKNTQSLSERDIATCFKALGLHYERFTCKFPQRTGVTVSSIEYIKGQERGGKSSGTTYVDKGKHNFIFFMKEDGDRVEFKLASPTGSVGCGSASVEGYHAKTWGWLQIKELTQEKQPLFLYAANNEGIQGFSTPLSEDIEKVVEKYDFAVVIYASIADEE